MLATATAELAEGKSLSRRLLVFCGGVVAALAITTLKYNVVPRHNVTSFLITVSYQLLNNIRNRPRSHRAPAFSDSEP